MLRGFRDIGSSQAIATLGVAAVGLGEGKEDSRIFGQVRRFLLFETDDYKQGRNDFHF